MFDKNKKKLNLYLKKINCGLYGKQSEVFRNRLSFVTKIEKCIRENYKFKLQGVKKHEKKTNDVFSIQTRRRSKKDKTFTNLGFNSSNSSKFYIFETSIYILQTYYGQIDFYVDVTNCIFFIYKPMLKNESITSNLRDVQKKLGGFSKTRKCLEMFSKDKEQVIGKLKKDKTSNSNLIER